MNLYVDGIIYSQQKIGGISRYFSELLSRLNNVETNVKIEITTHNPIVGTLPQLPVFQFSSINNIRPVYPQRFFNIVTNPINRCIENNYWKKKVNGVFHSTYFTTYSSLRIPQVLTVYDMIYEKFPSFFNKKSDALFVRQKKKCIDMADSVICISNSTKNDLIDLYNIDENKIHVTHLGVSSHFSKIYDEKIKRDFMVSKRVSNPFLLFVGSRNGYKNFSTFIKAYANLHDFHLEVVVVGGGGFSNHEQELLHKLGLINKVHNFSFVLDEELILWYNCASAFVFPSLYEGFGIPLLEAMACGTPIVASNTSSFPEVIGSCGTLFDPLDIQDISDKIAQVLKGVKSNFLNEGIERSKQFTWDKTAKETLEIYKKYN